MGRVYRISIYLCGDELTAPVINQPVAGFYKMRLVKNGPWVPVQIAPYSTTRQFSVLCAWVGDGPADLIETWHRCAGRPISDRDYRYMMSLREWAHANDRAAPEANPYKAIDISTMKPDL